MKKLFTLMLIVISSMAQSQFAPTVYYQFDETNPMAPTIGSTNLNANGGVYTNPVGPVGKYLAIRTNAATYLRGQNVNAGTSASIQLLFRKTYLFDAGNSARLFTWGDFNASIRYPDINFSTPNTSSSSTITFDGINRRSWSYLMDGNWHLLSFVYTGSLKQLWIDGMKVFEEACPSGTVSGVLDISNSIDYAKLRADIDEIAMYSDPITGNQIQQNYLDFQAGNHYTTALAGSVPTQALTGTLDATEFNIGTAEPTGQLQVYPMARYKPGHTLLRNFNWMDPRYQGGLFQTRWTNAQAVVNSVAVQTELANNWHYYFNVEMGTTVWGNAYVNAANINPQWKLGITIFRAQLNGNNPLLQDQSLPNNHYLQNSGGQFLDGNGNVTSNKIWRPTAPTASYNGDGLNVKAQFADLFTRLNKDVDWVSENGEVFPYISPTGLANDPVVNAARIASGLTPATFLSRKIAENDNASYRDQFMSHPRLVNGKYTYYTQDGDPLDKYNWVETRKLSHSINGKYYPTGDFYVRYPDNWRYWISAWHGWQWVVESRPAELAAGDNLSSHFITAGWDHVEENNVRPAQWLGLLKILNVSGCEFFYTGFFSLGAPWPDAKNWIWQAATPVYAQAVTSRYEDILRNGTLLNGDVPDSYITALNPGYTYYTGDIRKLVAIRKHNTLNKYIIAGTYQPNSNLGGTEKTGVATIKLGSDSLIFNVRRQGSVYVYDKTVTPAVFYALDNWHDTTHYERWTRDFDFEAEVHDNNPSGVAVETFAAWPDLTNYRSYMTFSGAQQLQYNFQPRTSGTYYAYVLAKTESLNDSTGFTLQLDNGTTKTVSCIVDTTWRWYKFNTSDGVAISYGDVSPANHMLKLTSINNKLQVDRIVLSLNSSLYASIATVCSTAPPVPPVATITAGGPTTFCAGGSVTLTANSATSYLWSTGATTQSIVASTSGTYIVTITTAAGSDASNPVSVNSLPRPLGTITASGSTALCLGQSVTLTSTAASGYLWNTGETTQSISVNNAGTFSVTITGSNGCAAVSIPTMSVTVTNCSGVTAPGAVTASGKRWYKSTMTWTHAANDATGFETELIYIPSGVKNKKILSGATRSIDYQWLKYKGDYRFRIRTNKNGVYSSWVEITFKTY